MIDLSIERLQQRYRDGLKVRDVIGSLRAQALSQSDYNAWIYLLSEAELEPYFQRLENADTQALPLYGVPFAIKDNIDLMGVDTTAACPDFRYRATESAYVVQALIEAGAIPLGKTNLDQFATGLVGTRSPYGQGKNVFNSDYISGGSSSGSAIACALGQVSFALGTDTAGSGRVPAALNNLIGLKPSKGLLSTRGVVPACRSLDCVSIFALCCEDAARIFDIAADYDRRDAFARPRDAANRGRYFSAPLSANLRCAIPKELDFQGDTECAALFATARSTLVNMGVDIDEIDFGPFLKAAKLLYEGPWVAERWLATQAVNAESMLEVISTIIKSGDKPKATDAFAAQYQLQECKRACDLLIADVDFVLVPTFPKPYKRSEIDADPIALNSRLGTYTNFMNLLDYAACAVPVGALPSGVHWGVTLFHHAHSDVRLLRIADALHKKLGLAMGAGTAQVPVNTTTAPAQPSDTIDVAVCGAHLDGQPLNWQLRERGAILLESSHSAENYALYALPDGKRPALVRDDAKNYATEVEIWRLPSKEFGSFVAGIPSPLGLGKITLADGREINSFICEHGGIKGATDISAYGGWRAWLNSRKT